MAAELCQRAHVAPAIPLLGGLRGDFAAHLSTDLIALDRSPPTKSNSARVSIVLKLVPGFLELNN